MKTTTILKSGGILLTSALAMQTGYAQVTPGFNYLTGNQVGPNGQLIIQAAPSGSEGPYMHWFTNDFSNPQIAGSMNYIPGYNPNGSAPAHNFQLRGADGSWNSNFTILQNGQVKVGSKSPTTQTDYRLAVDGKLVAQSLYVTSPSTWADFVFAPTYQRMPLAELETYLQRNKHLPAIPPAAEVAAKGYSVSEMDAKLLQTVEELTLHVIELGKQIQELKSAQAIK